VFARGYEGNVKGALDGTAWMNLRLRRCSCSNPESSVLGTHTVELRLDNEVHVVHPFGRDMHRFQNLCISYQQL
jgi:hypothetical protein